MSQAANKAESIYIDPQLSHADGSAVTVIGAVLLAMGIFLVIGGYAGISNEIDSLGSMSFHGEALRNSAIGFLSGCVLANVGFLMTLFGWLAGRIEKARVDVLNKMVAQRAVTG